MSENKATKSCIKGVPRSSACAGGNWGSASKPEARVGLCACLLGRRPRCTLNELVCRHVGDCMAVWWKRRSTRGDIVLNEAGRFLETHGDRAYEVARKAARTARNKRDHRLARHYSHVALQIAELTDGRSGLNRGADEGAQVGGGLENLD